MNLLRKKRICIALFFFIFYWPCIGFPREIFVKNSAISKPFENVFSEKERINSNQSSTESSQPESLKKILKGEKSRNAILLGLWSSHFRSKPGYRKEHNLVGIQYNGYFAGTFANSHSDQVYTIGIARTVAKKKLGRHWLLEASYVLGPMYGYRERIPNIKRFSILPVASFNLSFHNIGIDLNLVPGNAISFNTRINF